MSAELKLKALAGGSLTLQVDDTLTTDETFNVSESGIENGSNANGSYTKFPDGTLICSHTVSITDVTAAAGALFSSAPVLWAYPISFVGAVPQVNGNDIGSTILWMGILPRLTSADVRALSYTSISGTRNVRVTAIGRWK